MDHNKDIRPATSKSTKTLRGHPEQLQINDECCKSYTDLFFTQISGRNFLPELCGEVHPETALFQALRCALYSTEQSTFFEGKKRAKICREKGRKRGGQERRQKGKKDARKQVGVGHIVVAFGLSNFSQRACNDVRVVLLLAAHPLRRRAAVMPRLTTCTNVT